MSAHLGKQDDDEEPEDLTDAWGEWGDDQDSCTKFARDAFRQFLADPARSSPLRTDYALVGKEEEEEGAATTGGGNKGDRKRRNRGDRHRIKVSKVREAKPDLESASAKEKLQPEQVSVLAEEL